MMRIISVATLAICVGLAMVACNAAYDAQIKENASHTIGRTPSDAELRDACLRLQKSGWDYSAASMNTLTSNAAAGSMVAIMASITTVAGGDTSDYCEDKLNES